MKINFNYFKPITPITSNQKYPTKQHNLTTNLIKISENAKIIALKDKEYDLTKIENIKKKINSKTYAIDNHKLAIKILKDAI